jgi:hypothetical protein
LVPPNPKPDTAAARGRSVLAGHGTASTGIVRFVVSSSNASGAAVNRFCAGIASCAMPSSAWMSDTTPAAHPVCPMSDLFDVTRTGAEPA